VPFEKRVGRMMEGLRLCRALWTGEKVNWNGRWTVVEGSIGPTPFRPGGPPIWLAGSTPAALERVGKHFDGWFPIDTDPAAWRAKWAEIGAHARAAGRDPSAFSGAMYLTLSLAEDTARAEEKLMAYLEGYYGPRAASVRRRQACYAGPAEGVAAYLDGYAKAGVGHLIIRFAGGDHARQLETLARIRADLGW
jgi:alkanesulfonate monooxygenase SsuD/methylene tetrahydromethanopterin reductase-like flavin-dependent oxidoreductase (luciferase family)